jgi:hypothetical protein
VLPLQWVMHTSMYAYRPGAMLLAIAQLMQWLPVCVGMHVLPVTAEPHSCLKQP